jgi:hypothetical protein
VVGIEYIADECLSVAIKLLYHRDVWGLYTDLENDAIGPGSPIV